MRQRPLPIRLYIRISADARDSQNSSQRLLIWQQRSAIMALAPLTVQCIPDSFSRWPMTVLYPASTTPDPTNKPWLRNSACCCSLRRFTINSSESRRRGPIISFQAPACDESKLASQLTRNTAYVRNFGFRSRKSRYGNLHLNVNRRR